MHIFFLNRPFSSLKRKWKEKKKSQRFFVLKSIKITQEKGEKGETKNAWKHFSYLSHFFHGSFCIHRKIHLNGIEEEKKTLLLQERARVVVEGRKKVHENWNSSNRYSITRCNIPFPSCLSSFNAWKIHVAFRWKTSILKISHRFSIENYQQVTIMRALLAARLCIPSLTVPLQ